MQVYFNDYLYSKTAFPKSVHRKNTAFSAKSATCIKFSDIKKISSESEYDSVLRNLKNNGHWLGWWEKGNKFDEGLMPYIGSEDISYRINYFLREGRLIDNRYTENTLKDIIRVFAYALDETDKLYGKYSGIVYRYGKVDLTSKNYLSTAKEPIAIPVSVVPETERRCMKQPLCILRVKSGHKIVEVQKKFGNEMYINESEILIDPTTFKEVSDNDSDMCRAEIELREILNKKNYYGFSKVFHYEEM